MSQSGTMRFYFEKTYPLGVAALTTIAICWFGVFQKSLPDVISQLADNAISISVTLIGFLLTILTIINSIETRRMEFVRQGDGFPRLIMYLRGAIIYNLVLIFAAFLIKYVEHRDSEALQFVMWGRNIPDYLFIFLFIFVLLLTLRFTREFIALLTEEPK